MLRVDGEERSILIEQEREREKRRKGVSKPLVHPVTKERKGAGNPEITKVKKRDSHAKEEYIYIEKVT